MLKKANRVAIWLSAIGILGAIGTALLQALVTYVQTKHGATVAMDALGISLRMSEGFLLLGAIISMVVYKKQYPKS